ncbi:MAG: dihydroneopterin aldolase [Bacteroidales bacterium]|jgi:dihydroneopterin aldolase|nr:dihydroneopterin aldolase [Bacteroidales bacterium]
MGIIELENIEIYAHHGCFETERVVGNKFVVQVRLLADCSKAAKTDNLSDALNYQTVYDIVEREMKIPSALIEHVAGRILNALFAEFPHQLEEARVTVSKIAPPLRGHVQKASVTLEKRRQ